MAEKSNWIAGALPPDVVQLILDLFIEDQNTKGQPTLKPEQAPLAMQWLQRTLIDSAARWAHIDELKRRYRGVFRLAVPRGDGIDGGQPVSSKADASFRHHELWPEPKAEAVANQGLATLTDDEVARLLLNPIALWDIADLIDATQPDTWSEPMTELGRELLALAEEEMEDGEQPGVEWEQNTQREKKRKLVLRTTGSPGARPTAMEWPIPTTGDESRRLAEQMYGDPERAFTLVLHGRPVAGHPDLLEFDLEVAPVPTRSDVTVEVRFRSGDSRRFTLKVPPELKIDPSATPRLKTRSAPCESLPAKTFVAEEGPVWAKDEPLTLLLRGVVRRVA